MIARRKAPNAKLLDERIAAKHNTAFTNQTRQITFTFCHHKKDEAKVYDFFSSNCSMQISSCINNVSHFQMKQFLPCWKKIHGFNSGGFVWYGKSTFYCSTLPIIKWGKSKMITQSLASHISSCNNYIYTCMHTFFCLSKPNGHDTTALIRLKSPTLHAESWDVSCKWKHGKGFYTGNHGWRFRIQIKLVRVKVHQIIDFHADCTFINKHDARG